MSRHIEANFFGFFLMAPVSLMAKDMESHGARYTKSRHSSSRWRQSLPRFSKSSTSSRWGFYILPTPPPPLHNTWTFWRLWLCRPADQQVPVTETKRLQHIACKPTSGRSACKNKPRSISQV